MWVVRFRVKRIILNCVASFMDNPLFVCNEFSFNFIQHLKLFLWNVEKGFMTQFEAFFIRLISIYFGRRRTFIFVVTSTLFDYPHILIRNISVDESHPKILIKSVNCLPLKEFLLHSKGNIFLQLINLFHKILTSCYPRGRS